MYVMSSHIMSCHVINVTLCDITASSVTLGQLVGCCLGGYLGGRYGPRTTIHWSCVLGLLGWASIGGYNYTT